MDNFRAGKQTEEDLDKLLFQRQNTRISLQTGVNITVMSRLLCTIAGSYGETVKFLKDIPIRVERCIIWMIIMN